MVVGGGSMLCVGRAGGVGGGYLKYVYSVYAVWEDVK